MMKKVVFVLCILSLVGLSFVLAKEETIGSLFKGKIEDKIPVKVYIKEVINQSGQSQVMPEAFTKALEKSLHQRRSIKFEVINNQAESDIQMSAVIKKYQYLVRGPLKPSPGIETTLLDAAATATQNYVEMSVEYAVVDTKTNKVLWQNTISEYIKKTMTPEESIPLIYDVVTRTFIWKCFGKANLRERNCLAM